MDAEAAVVKAAVVQTAEQRAGLIWPEIRTIAIDDLVAADKIGISEHVIDGLSVILRAQLGGREGVVGNAVDGESAVNTTGGVRAVVSEEGIWVTVRVGAPCTVEVGNSGATGENVAIFNTFHECVGV